MRDEARKLLWDASLAAERLVRFTAGKTFLEYQSDELLRSAVERQFAILGEALNRFAQSEPGVAAAIPDLRRIVGFRNILVHGDASVDDRIVWGVMEKHLAPLRQTLDRLLAER